VTPGTDSYWARRPKLTRTPKFPEQDHGLGTIIAIEGLVGARHVAVAGAGRRDAQRRHGRARPRRVRDDRGRQARGLLILSADPLADIGNIRRVAAVWKDGVLIDRGRLPQTRVLSVAPPTKPGTQQ
jgi:hypothetical protein